jgi:hypothetical protein
MCTNEGAFGNPHSGMHSALWYFDKPSDVAGYEQGSRLAVLTLERQPARN